MASFVPLPTITADFGSSSGGGGGFATQQSMTSINMDMFDRVAPSTDAAGARGVAGAATTATATTAPKAGETTSATSTSSATAQTTPIPHPIRAPTDAAAAAAMAMAAMGMSTAVPPTANNGTMMLNNRASMMNNNMNVNMNMNNAAMINSNNNNLSKVNNNKSLEKALAAKKGSSAASSKHGVGATTKKRVTKPRRVIPANKEYIPERQEPGDADVVSGRGGRSNHHPGNRPYWLKVLAARQLYRACESDHEKTRIARTIIKFVQAYLRGRFLQLEANTKRWFVLPPKVVLDKVKQALRDKYVPLWARDMTAQQRAEALNKSTQAAAAAAAAAAARTGTTTAAAVVPSSQAIPMDTAAEGTVSACNKRKAPKHKKAFVERKRIDESQDGAENVTSQVPPGAAAPAFGPSSSSAANNGQSDNPTASAAASSSDGAAPSTATAFVPGRTLEFNPFTSSFGGVSLTGGLPFNPLTTSSGLSVPGVGGGNNGFRADNSVTNPNSFLNSSSVTSSLNFAFEPNKSIDNILMRSLTGAANSSAAQDNDTSSSNNTNKNSDDAAGTSSDSSAGAPPPAAAAAATTGTADTATTKEPSATTATATAAGNENNSNSNNGGGGFGTGVSSNLDCLLRAAFMQPVATLTGPLPASAVPTGSTAGTATTTNTNTATAPKTGGGFGSSAPSAATNTASAAGTASTATTTTTTKKKKVDWNSLYSGAFSSV